MCPVYALFWKSYWGLYGFKNCQDGLGVQVKIDKKTKNLEFKEINFYLQPNGQTIEKPAEKW